MMSAWKYVLLTIAASILVTLVASMWLPDRTANNLGDGLMAWLLASRVFRSDRELKRRSK